MTRWLILSDIHGNLPALEAVLASVATEEYELISLGDVVGYGPYPGQCLELMRQQQARLIMGNHDAGLIKKIPLHDFNQLAVKAIKWTRRQLSHDDLAYISSFSRGLIFKNWQFVHGGPESPLDEYLDSKAKIKWAMRGIKSDYLVTGHTHKPLFAEFGEQIKKLNISPGERYHLKENTNYYFNPGSVGQPRDGDPRASFTLVNPDGGYLEYRRVKYDIEQTVSKIREEGLPLRLAERLWEGR